MTKGLIRLQNSREIHFVTFSCYQRRPHLSSPHARDCFEQALEEVRQRYQFMIGGYVVMPEHVHLLISEPDQAHLATALQVLKQKTSRQLKPATENAFWQRRYYDFNVWSAGKFREKLKYIHRNPVRRCLVRRPEDWPWSSFRHYATGLIGRVEIESQWAASRRERTPVG